VLIDLQWSVSDLTAEEMEAILAESPLDGVCVVGSGGLPASAKVAAAEKCGLKVFVGLEVPMEKGRIVLVPPSNDFDWEDFYDEEMTDSEVIERARQEGCAVVLCHPYLRDSEAAMGDRALQLSGFDAVMCICGSGQAGGNDLALDLAENLSVSSAGGTGQSTNSGRGATFFIAEPESQEQFVAELRGGDCWAVALGDEDGWTVQESRFEDGDRGDGHRGGRRGDRQGPRRGDRRGGRDRSDHRRRGGRRPGRSRDRSE